MLTGFLHGMLLPVHLSPVSHTLPQRLSSACLSPPLTALRGEDCLCQHPTQAKVCPHTRRHHLSFHMTYTSVENYLRYLETFQSNTHPKRQVYRLGNLPWNRLLNIQFDLMPNQRCVVLEKLVLLF